jgi:hypothetical protein
LLIFTYYICLCRNYLGCLVRLDILLIFTYYICLCRNKLIPTFMFCALLYFNVLNMVLSEFSSACNFSYRFSSYKQLLTFNLLCYLINNVMLLLCLSHCLICFELLLLETFLCTVKDSDLLDFAIPLAHNTLLIGLPLSRNSRHCHYYTSNRCHCVALSKLVAYPIMNYIRYLSFYLPIACTIILNTLYFYQLALVLVLYLKTMLITILHFTFKFILNCYCYYTVLIIEITCALHGNNFNSTMLLFVLSWTVN